MSGEASEFEQVRWQAVERAEAVVLSACLLAAEETMSVIGQTIRAEMFYSDRHRQIFQTISDLLAAGRPVDVVIVAEELHATSKLQFVGGTPYLSELTDKMPVYLPRHLEAHAETMRDYWRLRQARAVALTFEGATRAGIPVAEMQGAIEEVEAAFSEIAYLSQKRDLVVLRDGMTAAFEALVAASQNSGLTGIPTLMPEVDRLITGLHRGDFYIIAGRPGHGKTAFALQLARAVAHQQVGVAFFSLEMPLVQLMFRMLSSECEIDHARFRNPATLGPYWDKLTNGIARIGGYPLWVDDEAAITLADVRRRVRKLKAAIRNGTAEVPASSLGVVMIDYLQLMEHASRSANSREQEISSISRGLKQLAKDEDVAVIALSQLNRKIEQRSTTDRRPQLSDLRESGAIEQDADTVAFVNRPELYSDEAKWKGIAEIIIGKQRNGPAPAVVRTRFNGTHQRFSPLEEQPWDEYDDFQEVG